MININELRQSLGAVTPEEVGELLDRLEAAETAWKVSDKSLYDLTEKVIPNLRDQLETVEKERDALRARIEAMERQEPGAFALYSGWASKAVYLSEIEACEQRDRRQLTADLGGSLEAYRVVPLYRAPGAQPAPSVPEGISRVSLDFYWDSAKQHHIPTVLVEFEPVPVGSPNDAKGWQDRDRFAALTSGAKGE